MLRIIGTLLFAACSQAAYADVLDHHNGLVAQLVHQTFGGHHLPFTMLLIVACVVAIGCWRVARKRTQ